MYGAENSMAQPPALVLQFRFAVSVATNSATDVGDEI